MPWDMQPATGGLSPTNSALAAIVQSRPWQPNGPGASPTDKYTHGSQPYHSRGAHTAHRGNNPKTYSTSELMEGAAGPHRMSPNVNPLFQPWKGNRLTRYTEINRELGQMWRNMFQMRKNIKTLEELHKMEISNLTHKEVKIMM